MEPKNNAIQFIFLLLSLLLISTSLFGQELLETPKPTHFEAGVPCAKLVLIKEIKCDFNDDVFFAMPWSVQVSQDGQYIYIYDSKLIKVLIFNNEYEYIGQFLESGQGPGEVSFGYGLNKLIYTGRDNKFYVTDSMNDKLIQFSNTGKYIKDIRMNRLGKYWGISPAVIDKDGYIYFYSISNGIIDKLAPDMSIVKTYLDRKLNGNFVIFKPAYEKFYEKTPDPENWLNAAKNNTIYDLTGDGRLVIYLFRSSTAYIIKNDKLEKKFDILVDEVLPIYKKRAKEAYEKQKKLPPGRGIRQAKMFHYAFIDRDEPALYLQISKDNITNTLYKFDLKGNLVKMLPNIDARILTVKNGLFYGLSIENKNPVVFKEETKK